MTILEGLEGFELYIPPTPPTTDKDLPAYEIFGVDGQVVQIPLGPGESASCDRSAMVYHSDGVTVRAKFGGFMNTISRIAGGGALFSVTYTNDTGELGYVSFAPNVPGLVCPIDMTEYPCILCSRDSFLCSNGTPEDTKVSAQINPTSPLGCLFSGEGLVLQKVEGGTMSFLTGMGTVIKKTLEEGEEILIDTDALLAMTEGTSIDVRQTAQCCSCAQLCGGEGFYNTVLTGPGVVWMESMSIGKLRSLFPQASSGNDGSQEAGAADE